MTRSVSTTFKQAVAAQETGEAFLVLLTISHADLAAPIRVSSDAVNTTSRGETYVAFPFDLSLPDDNQSSAPRARLTIDNVDRQIVEAIRQIQSPPTVQLVVVLSSDPDTVEAEFPAFKLRSVEVDILTVRGDLTIELFEDEPYPAGSFVPSAFPGLF